MVADKVENLGSCLQPEKYQREIEEFIKALDMQKLEEGWYMLREDILVALAQEYHTRGKDSSRMESHKKCADLQYIRKGGEMIYTDRVEEPVPVEDCTPEEDILSYEPRRDSGADVLESGMFGYHGPQDAHMSCITYLGNCDMVKVVLKIKIT